MNKSSQIVSDVNLDGPGTQRGFLRLYHSTHQSAYGYIPIPLAVFRNGEGPTVLLIAGTHGDEYEGQIALGDFIRSFNTNAMQGRVIVLPAANLPAAAAGLRTSPIDGGNLNRMYPGNSDGGVTEQTAYFIEHELVARADIIVDLHSGGSSLMYLPCAAITQYPDSSKRNEQLMEVLKAFGAPISYVAKASPSQGAAKTTAGASMRKGKLDIGTELGGGGTVTPSALSIAKQGVHNILAFAGITSDRVPAPRATKLFQITGPDCFTHAPARGLYEPLVELGDIVKAGQPAARIHHIESPWDNPREVSFPADGFVLCKRVPGRVEQGDCLFQTGRD